MPVNCKDIFKLLVHYVSFMDFLLRLLSQREPFSNINMGKMYVILYSLINAMTCSQYVFAVDYGTATPVSWVTYMNWNLKIRRLDQQCYEFWAFRSRVLVCNFLLGWGSTFKANRLFLVLHFKKLKYYSCCFREKYNCDSSFLSDAI